MNRPVRIIIAGSRHLDGPFVADLVREAFFRALLDLTHPYNAEIVSGACPNGVDQIGEKLAALYDLDLKRFPADWETHGKAAGPKRNAEMADYADALVLVWDGKSRGSMSMAALAKQRRLPIYEKIVKTVRANEI